MARSCDFHAVDLAGAVGGQSPPFGSCPGPQLQCNRDPTAILAGSLRPTNGSLIRWSRHQRSEVPIILRILEVQAQCVPWVDILRHLVVAVASTSLEPSTLYSHYQASPTQDQPCCLLAVPCAVSLCFVPCPTAHYLLSPFPSYTHRSHGVCLGVYCLYDQYASRSTPVSLVVDDSVTVVLVEQNMDLFPAVILFRIYPIQAQVIQHYLPRG